ncbi:Phosphatidylinositol N-acetylglucosaminyltransferase subunit gpi15 [Schizosaccharomyces pombe]
MLTIKRYPGAIEFTVHTSKSYGTQMFALCFISFVIGATSLAIGRSPKIIITLVELSFLLSLFHIISGVNHESLLVIRDLGVQTNCHSIVPWKSSSKLIPLDSIRDIFINEGFRKFDVCYYMGIAIESETEIHVVFPTLLPRHDVLQKVYKETVILLANNS